MDRAESERQKSVLIVSLLLILVGVLLLFGVSPATPVFTNEVGSIGLSLITAGVIALTLDRVSVSAISGKLTGIIDRGLQELKVRNFGVSEITPSTPYDEIYESMKKSAYFDLAQTWSPDMRNILDSAAELVRNGGRLRVFLLHPESEAAKQRSSDLWEEPDYVPNKIRSDISQMRSFRRRMQAEQGLSERDAAARIKLYLHRSLPTCAIYRTEQKAWLAFYWLGAQSDARMNIVVDGTVDNPAAAQCAAHFEMLERAAVNVRLDRQEIPQLPEIGLMTQTAAASTNGPAPRPAT
ncbi:MAG: hypothetical protein AB7P23_05815 [Amphiplicatus sp.]